jgi:hypothetical protein
MIFRQYSITRVHKISRIISREREITEFIETSIMKS